MEPIRSRKRPRKTPSGAASSWRDALGEFRFARRLAPIRAANACRFGVCRSSQRECLARNERREIDQDSVSISSRHFVSRASNGRRPAANVRPAPNTRSIAGARVRNASRAPNGTGRRGRSSARRRMSEPAARSPPAREAGNAGRANAAAPRRRERPASAICNTRTRAGLTYINDRACDAAPQRRRPPIVAPCTGAAALTWLNARGHARRMLVHTCFACCSRGSPARSSDAARQARRCADSTVTRAPGTTLAARLRSQPACSRRNAGPDNSATHTIMSFRSRFTWRTAVFGPSFRPVSRIVATTASSGAPAVAAPPTDVAVLVYHRFSNVCGADPMTVGVATFEAQLAHLRRLGYRFVRCAT